MLKQFLILLASAFAAPSAFAVNNTLDGSYMVMDDDDDDDRDDDKEIRVLSVSRPEIICRNISERSAELVLKVNVRNKTDRTITAIVQVEVDDQDDRQVAFVNDKVTIPAGRTIVSKNVVTIKNPHLYSAEPSYRYEAEAELLDMNGENITDSKERKFYISRNYGKARKYNNLKVLDRSQKMKLQKSMR